MTWTEDDDRVLLLEYNAYLRTFKSNDPYAIDTVMYAPEPSNVDAFLIARRHRMQVQEGHGE